MSGDNYASDSKTTGDRDGSMDGSTAGAPSAPLHLLMGDDGDRLPSGPPPGRFEFLTTDKLNQHDVMCGRGGGMRKMAGGRIGKDARERTRSTCGTALLL